jgi:REP element-mobilizing transposase RayT
MVQGSLPLRQHGGKRVGAGRKPRHGSAGVPHAPRVGRRAAHPSLVTAKLRPHLPRLRGETERAALLQAFVAGKQREGFRLVHFVALNDHLHLLVEADSVVTLRLGMQGLLIRTARALNRLWRRRGPVFADRFHDRALASPREVRNALVYVFGNARKHAASGRMVKPSNGIDEHASARWFDGFADAGQAPLPLDDASPVVAPRTWLLTKGWRRHGLIGVAEAPRLDAGSSAHEPRATSLDAGARGAPAWSGSSAPANGATPRT